MSDSIFQQANYLLRCNEFAQALDKYHKIWSESAFLRKIIAWNFAYCFIKASSSETKVGHLYDVDKLLISEFGLSVKEVFYGRLLEKEKVALKRLEFYISAKNKSGSFPVSPDKQIALLMASEMIFNVGYSAAIAYARRSLPKSLIHTLEVLRANAAIDLNNEKMWLEHVNRYLTYFGVSKIRLENSSRTLFNRFRSDVEKITLDGPLISILVPAFNAESTISMSVNSLLNQSWRNVEVIIVDDCSTDNTWSVMQGLAKSDDRVKIFHNKINVGPYVSKNIALSQAKGEWITGHDADDWAHPERIERQFKFCYENDYDVSLSGMVRMDGSGRFIKLNKIGTWVHDGACRTAFISLMIRAQYLRDIFGCWDNVRVGGDSELINRIQSIRQRPIPLLKILTMICYDNPDGLTNDQVLGIRKGSPRQSYKNNFLNAQAGFNKFNCRYSLESSVRPFPAPHELLNGEYAIRDLVSEYRNSGVVFQQVIDADVVVITNLNFPGGNTSSTLDEMEFFIAKGLRVFLVHCPTDSSLGRPFSSRFDGLKNFIVNWTEIGDFKTKVIIIRHPMVMTSFAFRAIASKLHATNAFVVINNSSTRTNGEPVFDFDRLVEAGKSIDAESLEFCPIGPTIREELVSYRNSNGQFFDISYYDWNPTFDFSLYGHQPKVQFDKPYRVGRHGRDGVEKWLENPLDLKKAYPDNSDFKISVLGGASVVETIIGYVPSNWVVYDFNSITPSEFLGGVDVFVYFPHSDLKEAFGRTIVEAMYAGVPVILPFRFYATFGDLPIYCEPGDVERIVRQLATCDADLRVKYLEEVQNIAVERFSSAVISKRLSRTSLGLSDIANERNSGLSKVSSDFRHEICVSAENSRFVG